MPVLPFADRKRCDGQKVRLSAVQKVVSLTISGPREYLRRWFVFAASIRRDVRFA
jgi:hypothetical protein